MTMDREGRAIDEEALRQGLFDDEREQVGYGSPPRSTRFAKGQSGNPKGRPRKAKLREPSIPESGGIDQLFEQHFKQKMRVREGERIREMARPTAYLRNLEKLGAEGKVSAARYLMQLAERSARLAEAQRQENEDYWLAYKRDYPARAKQAEKNGAPLPDWFPHPEDVIVRPGRDVRIIGPIDEANYEEHGRLREIRDALHMKLVYTALHGPVRKGQPSPLTLDQLLIAMIDRHLPTRWRLDGPAQQKNEIRLMCLTARAFRQELREAFDKQGWPFYPDKPFPPIPGHLLKGLGISPAKGSAKSPKRKTEDVS